MQTLRVAQCKSLIMEHNAVLDVPEILKQRLMQIEPVFEGTLAAIVAEGSQIHVRALPQITYCCIWMPQNTDEECAVLVEP